jgi:hypothetical protein
MPKTKISEFDSTPANNTDIDSINIAEGCAPSGINNAIRELMSQLKDQQTGAAGDNFTVGGNLVVTGTSVHTGATTFTGAVVMSTALPVASGGTGATTAGNARTNLSAAGSGANSDITSITGLTTALTVAQGGTGAATHTSKGVLIGNGTSAVTTVSPGTSGNVLTSDGTSWTSATGAYALTSGTAVATTSGTNIDFTSIPSWVKRITVMFQGVSTNGTSFILVRLGYGSTTYETSGYTGGGGYNSNNGSGGNFANSVGFNVVGGVHQAAALMAGTVTLTNISGNTWVCSSAMGSQSLLTAAYGGGSIVVSGALTAIRITTVNGTDTFDAGSINILYE